MIPQRSNYLTIKKNTTKLSDSYNRFINDTDLVLSDSDYIYIEYFKNINALYFDFLTAATSNTITLEYLDTSDEWQEYDTDEILDETINFSQSGFIFFDNSIETNKQWRISLAVGATIKLSGINLVFADTEDLRTEVSAISSFLPRGVTTPIKYLESATKYIVRKINNSGKYKYNSEINVSEFGRFDFLDINEVREACTYYALYAMYFERSDDSEGSDGDIYMLKADKFLEKFESSFAVFKGGSLTLDEDDSGDMDEEENETSREKVKFTR